MDKAWFDVITRPFSWTEVEIKVQSVTKDKTKALPVAYFDARIVRRRLNEAFGPDKWTVKYRELFGSGGLVGVVAELIATTPEGTTVRREEVGIPSDIEPLKGAYSDALKRCFTALGNDWLYDIQLGWHPYDSKKSFAPFTKEVLERIRGIYEMQTTRIEAENPIVIYIEEPPEERKERPDRGVKAILNQKTITNGEGGRLEL